MWEGMWGVEFEVYVECGPVGVYDLQLNEVFTQELFYFRKANGDGRASAFLTWEEILPMTYRMRFDIQDYFKTSNVDTFYPYAEVVFQIKDPKAHYHIPLLLSPYGYSTYRGS